MPIVDVIVCNNVFHIAPVDNNRAIIFINIPSWMSQLHFWPAIREVDMMIASLAVKLVRNQDFF